MRRRTCANCGTSYDTKLSGCPECKKGHPSPVAVVVEYQPCEWPIGERCRYPGTIKNPGDEWYCHGHAELARQAVLITRESASYQHGTTPDQVYTDAAPIRTREQAIDAIRLLVQQRTRAA